MFWKNKNYYKRSLLWSIGYKLNKKFSLKDKFIKLDNFMNFKMNNQTLTKLRYKKLKKKDHIYFNFWVWTNKPRYKKIIGNKF